jgi:hypothetical protein
MACTGAWPSPDVDGAVVCDGDASDELLLKLDNVGDVSQTQVITRACWSKGAD